jgi:hypothetical protein
MENFAQLDFCRFEVEKLFEFFSQQYKIERKTDPEQYPFGQNPDIGEHRGAGGRKPRGGFKNTIDHPVKTARKQKRESAEER